MYTLYCDMFLVSLEGFWFDLRVIFRMNDEMVITSLFLAGHIATMPVTAENNWVVVFIFSFQGLWKKCKLNKTNKNV